MRKSLKYVALVLVLTACHRRNEPQVSTRDAELRKVLIGTWGQEGRGATTIFADGSFSGCWSNSNGTKIWALDGTWTITDDVYVATITNSQSWGTTNRVSEGRVDRLRIIRLTSEQFVHESDGQTNSLIRVRQ
ncbi:MAG: hypothetical protein C5B50_25420 [Verrucomicrobia bacterium]|nr:MAG: hypothetical protein C5B50_25420 [Verrucomicrobiota bacterium]